MPRPTRGRRRRPRGLHLELRDDDLVAISVAADDTLVLNGLRPGAVAWTVCVPTSTGIETPQLAGDVGAPSRVTSILSAGSTTRTVSLASFGSSAAARVLASFSQSARPRPCAADAASR